MTELLKKCIQCGNLPAVFRLLESYSPQDLKVLEQDIDDFWKIGNEAIGKWWAQEAIKAGNFINANAAKALDLNRENMHQDLLSMLSEISSVVAFYLERKQESPHA